MPWHKLYTTMELVPVPLVPTCATKWVYKAVENLWCAKGSEMVAGDLDSVLATTSRCIPSAQAELAFVCAQRFVHRFAPNFSSIQDFKR